VTISKFQQTLLSNLHDEWTADNTMKNTTMFTCKSKSQKCSFQFLYDPTFELVEDAMWTMELLSVCDSVLLLSEYDIDAITPLISQVKENLFVNFRLNCIYVD
jgi:hypothetical protein